MPDLAAAARTRHRRRRLDRRDTDSPAAARAGADYALHSVTKYLAGHDDALLGAVVGRNLDDLRTFRSHTGITPAPDPAWLLLRG